MQQFKKVSSLFLLVTLLFSVTISTVYAEDTLNDLKDNAAQSKKNANKAADDLNTASKELDVINQSLKDLEQKEKNVQSEIKVLQSEIQKNTKAALTMLPFMQKNMHVNFILEMTFSASGNDDILRKSEASKTLTDSATQAVETLIIQTEEMVVKEDELLIAKTEVVETQNTMNEKLIVIAQKEAAAAAVYQAAYTESVDTAA